MVKKEPEPTLCRYNLYDFCHYTQVEGTKPSKEDCAVCLKAYRLRYGLRTIIEAKGFRAGITL